MKSPRVVTLSIHTPSHIKRLQNLGLVKDVNNHKVMRPIVIAVDSMKAKIIHGFGPINEGKILNWQLSPPRIALTMYR
jgi:hypothetical protein